MSDLLTTERLMIALLLCIGGRKFARAVYRQLSTIVTSTRHNVTGEED